MYWFFSILSAACIFGALWDLSLMHDKARDGRLACNQVRVHADDVISLATWVILAFYFRQ